MNSVKLTRDFLSGLCLGLPVAYPAVPLYWFAFAAFLIVFRVSARRMPRDILVILLSIFALSVFSNIVAPRPELLTLGRTLSSIFSLGFLVYGFFVDDMTDLVRGFLVPVNILAGLVVIGFFALGIYHNGSLAFVVPNLRLWGAPYFPDWPNYLALFFCLGALLQLFFFRHLTFALLNLTASVLTTSRIVFLAIGIAVVMWSLRGAIRSWAVGFIGVLGLLVSLNWLTIDTSAVDLTERLTRTADREAIYGVAANLIEQHPMLGFGSILFDDRVGPIRHASFHSFYLDLIIRFGVPVLVLMLVILASFDWQRGWRVRGFYSVVLTVVVGSFLQNYLRHPHIMMFYSAWIVKMTETDRFEELYGEPS